MSRCGTWCAATWTNCTRSSTSLWGACDRSLTLSNPSSHRLGWRFEDLTLFARRSVTLEGEAPERAGRGPHPKRAFEQVRHWAASLPSAAWRRIEVGDGERGLKFVD